MATEDSRPEFELVVRDAYMPDQYARNQVIGDVEPLIDLRRTPFMRPVVDVAPKFEAQMSLVFVLRKAA